MLRHYILRQPALMIAATALISSLATTSHAQGPALKPEKTTPRSRHRRHRAALFAAAARRRRRLFRQTGLKGEPDGSQRHSVGPGAAFGQVDIYQGGTATIHANVAGSDVIYIGAAVDKSTLVLFGQKGITTFEGLRGKAVATTSVGAFGEIAMRKTAKERGMEIGRDIKLLYHKGPPDALSDVHAEQRRRSDRHAAANRNGQE